MKKIKIMLVMLSLLGFSSVASSAVIDFEDVALGSYSSFSSGGVTFSLSIGNITVGDEWSHFVLGSLGTHHIDNGPIGGADFIFNLATPSNYFGLQIGATNFNQKLSVFDSSNNLLGLLNIPNQVSTQPYPYTGFYAFTIPGISKATLTGADDWVVVDNVTTAPVPEPETYAMMLAGLGLIGFSVRRRKQA